MVRAFLDANVCFSAAYSAKGRIRLLWELTDTELVTSSYAAVEAIRNMVAKAPAKLPELSKLLSRMGLVADSAESKIPEGIDLPAKDVPILVAAIACRASYLLTGDHHFDKLFGRVIKGVLVIRPSDYLELRRRELE